LAPSHWDYLVLLLSRIPLFTIYVPIYPLAPYARPDEVQPAALTLFKMLEARRGAGTTEWTTTGDSVGGTIALDNASRIAAIESLRGTVKNLILHSPLVTFEVDAATEEAANFVSSPVF
jgi:hypothetical protein